MNKPLNTSPMYLGRITAIAEEIREAMDEDTFDAETFFDTLDGETDALDMIDAGITLLTEYEAERDAAKAAAAMWTDRAKGKSDAIETCRRNLARILAATGEQKARAKLGTIAFQAGRTSADIYDLDAVPTQLCTMVKRPDAKAIKAALEAGEAVPGASLNNGEPIFTVRR